jgi:hypothetical protein
VEKQVAFVDEIGLERESRKLGATDEDVALRFPLEGPNGVGVEMLLESRVVRRSACRR